VVFSAPWAIKACIVLLSILLFWAAAAFAGGFATDAWEAVDCVVPVFCWEVAAFCWEVINGAFLSALKDTCNFLCGDVEADDWVAGAGFTAAGADFSAGGVLGIIFSLMFLWPFTMCGYWRSTSAMILVWFSLALEESLTIIVGVWLGKSCFRIIVVDPCSSWVCVPFGDCCLDVDGCGGTSSSSSSPAWTSSYSIPP